MLTDGSLTAGSVWRFTYDPRNFAAGETRTVYAETTVPADAVDLSYNGLFITITSGRDNSIRDSLEYRIRALAPVLTLEKDVDRESARPGDILTYVFRIQNWGHGAASSVVLVDAIPDNTTYVAGSIMIGMTSQTDEKDADQADFNISNIGAVTVHIPIIAAGDRALVIFKVRVD